MHVAGGRLDVAVLDPCPGVLSLDQPPAEARADDLGVAHRLEGDLRRRPMRVGRSRQSRELDAGFGEFAHVVLHAPESSLDRLHAVVRVHVLRGGVGRLELLEVEVRTEARHRMLKRCVLAGEVLEVADDRKTPALRIHRPDVGIGHRHRASTRSRPARAASVRSACLRRPARRRLGSRLRSRGHSPSRSTSTRPSAITSARNDGSLSASSRRTTSTRRPVAVRQLGAQLDDPFAGRASRSVTSTSTSLPGADSTPATDPNSRAKRTLCSVRSAALRADSSFHERRTYSRSDNDISNVLAAMAGPHEGCLPRPRGEACVRGRPPHEPRSPALS